jgi:hypothetical protein
MGASVDVLESAHFDKRADIVIPIDHDGAHDHDGAARECRALDELVYARGASFVDHFGCLNDAVVRG